MTALTYKTGGSGDFEILSAGTHFGVCTGVFDIGLQPGSTMYPKPKRILHLRFEIPAERVKDKNGLDAPAVIYERFTASMNKKAILRKALESWRGASFTDEQAEAFDVSKLLGAAATISVVHNKAGDKTYANIASLGPIPKGMPKPEPENKLVLYHAGHAHTYDQVPEWLQKKIDAQLRPETEEGVDDRRADEFPDDDIPF